MNAPHAYTPVFNSADLAPVAQHHFNEARPKTLKATVGVLGRGFMTIEHAARGHEIAFIESGSESRWWFKRGAKSAELFADLISLADKRGRRWRIVRVVSGLIVQEG